MHTRFSVASSLLGSRRSVGAPPQLTRVGNRECLAKLLETLAIEGFEEIFQVLLAY